jgi:hypothetical protein
VDLTIAQHRLQAEPTLDDLLEADRWARSMVQSLIPKKAAALAQ